MFFRWASPGEPASSEIEGSSRGRAGRGRPALHEHYFGERYFGVGAWFCGTVGGADGAGVTGCDFVWFCFTPENTEVGPVRLAAKIESVIEVTMKMIADQVVARERTEAAPRGPNAV